MRIQFYCAAAVAVALFSCSKPDNVLREYYFPIDSLGGKGMIYEYRDPRNQVLDHYCHYQSSKNADGKNILTNKRYNGLDVQDMDIREREASNGTVYEHYIFKITDTLGVVTDYQATIIENVIFPFAFPEKDSSAPFRFKMDFALPPDLDVLIHYTRERRFQAFSTFDWEGKKLPAVVFNTTETYQIDDSAKGGAWDMKNQIKEIFAQGIGLVYYEKKSNQDSIAQIYQLHKRYPAK